MDEYFDDDFDINAWIHDQDSDHPYDEWDYEDEETEWEDL